MKLKEILGKKILCEDLFIGKVEDIIFDPERWKITHLDVELTWQTAALVFNVKQGGIRNLLAVSAIDSVTDTVNIRVSKGQLHIYLKAPKPS